MNIYAIKDVKIGFKNPFYQYNDDVAKRSFTVGIKDTRSDMGRIKDDLELWFIGTWDDVTGTITGTKPEYLMGGKDVSLE